MSKFIELIDADGESTFVRKSSVIGVRVDGKDVMVVVGVGGGYRQSYTSNADAKNAQEEILIELESDT